ncbi:MAG: peptide chain release factor-like protein [Paracoccaceae bacterium]
MTPLKQKLITAAISEGLDRTFEHFFRTPTFAQNAASVSQSSRSSAVQLRSANPSDVVFESFRAGGPGGQHQNTTDSAVRATHRPTGLTAVAREMRSQHRNKSLALERLQTLMNAQATADYEAQKNDQNQLHNTLERGNPVRCFKGTNFREERCR